MTRPASRTEVFLAALVVSLSPIASGKSEANIKMRKSKTAFIQMNQKYYKGVSKVFDGRSVAAIAPGPYSQFHF